MKKFMLFSLAALLAVGMSSCSKDETDLGGKKPFEEDTQFFANIAIGSSDAMTRAYENGKYNPETDPEFDKGEGAENDVNTIFLIFYDEDGNRVSTTQVRKDSNREDVGDNNGKVDSRNHFYKGVVQIDVKHGSNEPAYVMAFVNPITSQNFEVNPDFATMEALSRTTRPSIMSENGNFAMSKSIYYGKNLRTGEENVKIVATPLMSNQLFNTREAAQAALDKEEEAGWTTEEAKSSVVDIYVERYAAKVNFQLEEKATKAKMTIGDHELTFVPDYWAVNAYESNTYIVKSFLKESALEEGELTPLTWAELNAQMPWKWNSAENHRCYWAQTPAYYAQAYPRVADDITDEGAVTYILGYYSYDEMADNATGKLNAKARKFEEGNLTKRTTIYARENTADGEALKKAASDPLASAKAAVASAVLVGHYLLDGELLEDEDYFYVRGNATNGYFFYTEDEMLDYFVNSTIHFALDAKGAQPLFTYETENGEIGSFTDPTYKDYFVIEHPNQAARAGQVVDSRFVTIQLNPDKFKEENSGIYAFIEGKYTEVTPANFDKVNTQMFFAAGTVQGYNGGKAFFSIPIKHLGFYREGNKNKDLAGTEKSFDWSAVHSGDFGLVRNHVYSIVVEDIQGLGNGIPDPDVPIVPPTDPEEYFIGARLIILNWAVVPDQRVVL